MGTSKAEPYESRYSLTESEFQQWLLEGVLMPFQAGTVLIGWGELRWQSEPSQNKNISFYFPDYFLQNGSSWLISDNTAVVSINELLALFDHFSEDESSVIHWENPSRELFNNGFNELHRLFQETELKKVVLYAFSKSKDRLSLAHRTQALKSILLYALEAPVFPYGFWKESEEGLLGATPELLFRIAATTPTILETMALAGTQKTDESSQTMMKDEKLLNEHHIVVEDIASNLEQLGEVEIGQLQVLQLPVLSHLYTPIKLKIHQQSSFSDFVKILHPTPALGGFPRSIAKKWLSDYSRVLPRGRFGAPVGYWDSRTNECSCYVAIRNIMWDDQHLFLGAGCGLVLQSDQQKEWDEILLKTTSIKRFLKL